MSENTVPFRYTLRPIPSQTAYVPVVGEPYNPPAPQFSLHLQVQLPQADPPLGNRDYGLAVDWQDDAGMRPSANKVQSLASDKLYSAGVLKLDEDGVLWAHYNGEDGIEWHNKLPGEPAEYIKTVLTKLFEHDYSVPAMQLDDEPPNVSSTVSSDWNDDGPWDDSNDDDKGDDDDEYED